MKQHFKVNGFFVTGDDRKKNMIKKNSFQYFYIFHFQKCQEERFPLDNLKSN